MSQENLEILQNAYQLINEDFASLRAGQLDRLLAFFHPEIVIELVDGPDPDVYEGHEGVRRWFENTLGVWASLYIEAEQFIQMDDWTVVHLRSRLRGEASGVELEVPFTAIRCSAWKRERWCPSHSRAAQ